MSANKMIMCDMREDGHIHVMAFRHDGKVVADSFRITCMGKEKDFSIDKLVEFGNEENLKQFASESILPCLLRAFPDMANNLSSMPICASICDMSIGRETPRHYSAISLSLTMLVASIAQLLLAGTTTIDGIRFDYDYVEDGVRITKVKNNGRSLFFPNQIEGVDVVEIASNACNSVSISGQCPYNQLIKFPTKLKRLSEHALPTGTPVYNDVEKYRGYICRFPKTLEEIHVRFAAESSTSGCYSRMHISIFDGPPPSFIGYASFYGRPSESGPLSASDLYGATQVYVNDLYYNDFLLQSANYDGSYRYMGAVLCRGMPGLKILPETDVLYEGNSFVSFTCTKAEAQIYYTLDGSEPQANVTAQCHKYEGPFALSHPSMVRAIAIASDYPYEAIEEKFYSVDQPDMPEIRAVKDISFDAADFGVEITANSPSGVIRYTTDDTEVTMDSPLYNGVFSITDTTVVRAKVFEAGRFASEETVVTFTREWYTVDAPMIEPSGAEFENVSQTVSLSCATEGATILYTTDGSDPKVNGCEYTMPFTIYKSCMVRAIAVKYDWKDSAEATATFTRADSLGEAADLYEYIMETDSAAPWTVDTAVSHDGVSSVRSGAIGNGSTTYLMASIKKAGTVSFWWKAQCEEPDEKDGEDGYCDYGVFLVDDVVKARIAGNDTGWRFVSVEVPTDGKHVLRWEYRKDNATSYAPDCVWLDQVQWIPAKIEVPVPAIDGKEYTGGQLQADISATEFYTVQNDGGVGVGNYPVTLTLTDGDNYRWAGGDSNPTTIIFTVSKATNEWITEPSIAGWMYGDAPSDPSMGAAKFGTVAVTYGALGTGRPTEPGEYVAVFAVEETGNWSGLTKDVTFKITASEESKLEESCDGLPVAIVSDGEGGWTVTITNDIDAVNLPIEIPDNLGPVTIDLNGHDLVGGDGKPVVVVVPGVGEGEPTQITIVNTGDSAAVQGGEGAPAIEVAVGAQDGTLVNVGDGVVVQGGGDGVPAVVGEIGENSGTVVKAAYDMRGARWDYAGAFEYDGKAKTVLVSGLPSGVTVASYAGNTATEPGKYTAHVALAYDEQLYDEPTIPDLKWEIKKPYRLTLRPNSTKYGTVSGGGTYAYGSKATLKAKAKKGYVFAGWFTDKACKKKLNPKGYDNRKATVKYAMPKKNSTIYAKFVTKKADKKALKFTSATAKLAKTPAKATSGAAFSLKLGISSASLPTVTASGLPKGLSIDKTTGEITGVGTVPGSYTAKVTVKSAAGNKITQNVKITVNVPSWAKGEFYGLAYPGGESVGSWATYLKFSVGATGKVSGKVAHKGKAYSFTSSCTSCTAAKATFSPKIEIGSSTFKPGTITVKKAKAGGVAVVEASDKYGFVSAQKKPELVKKGKALAALVGKTFTFTNKTAKSGLTKSRDKLTVKLENGDAVTVTGIVGGKRLSSISWVTLVSGKTTEGGTSVYTLYVDIIDATLKYEKTLVITATVGSGGTKATAAFAK